MEILAGGVQLHKPLQDTPLSGKVFLCKQGLSYLLDPRVVLLCLGRSFFVIKCYHAYPWPKNRPPLSRNVILLGHVLLANTWLKTYSLPGKFSSLVKYLVLGRGMCGAGSNKGYWLNWSYQLNWCQYSLREKCIVGLQISHISMSGCKCFIFL